MTSLKATCSERLLGNVSFGNTHGAVALTRYPAPDSAGVQNRCRCVYGGSAFLLRTNPEIKTWSFSNPLAPLRPHYPFPPRNVSPPLITATLSPPPVPPNPGSKDQTLDLNQAPNLEMINPLVSHRAMQEAVAHAAIPLPPRKKRAQAGDPADPPAGFVLNERGGLLRVKEAERATILRDPETGRNLECIVRRRIRNKQGREFLLLLAMDTPIEVLLADFSSHLYKEISDEEVVRLLPHATFALAKRKLHLVQSGFCLTVRGAVLYTEDDIIELDKGVGAIEAEPAAEGVEICRFRLEGKEYLLYTPFEPVLFVAYRDGLNDELQLAVDQEFEDRAVQTLLQEERRFQETVDEEEAFEDVIMRRKGAR